MSEQPWETHDPLCTMRRASVAYPRYACCECRSIDAARAEGYAKGIIEGDSGGRREGYRIGLAAARDAVAALPWAFVDPPGVLDTVQAAIDARQVTDE